MNENTGWTAQHRDDALSMGVFAVCAGGIAWVLGVLHVAVAYQERFAMALIALFTASYVISDGVEVAIKRMICTHTTVHVKNADDAPAGSTIFSGSEES